MPQVEIEVKERPILFSGAMVRAILDGKKTQTRRVVKPAAPYVSTDSGLDIQWVLGDLRCPYGEAGERLWVRETWRIAGRMATEYWVLYAAGGDKTIDVGWEGPTPKLDAKIHEDKQTPSIFMPRWASRITLEIKSVRIERVQDITEEDAKAEGVVAVISKKIHGWKPHVLEYSLLWDKINAKRGYGWEKNPWCWAIEFEWA